MNLFLSIAAAFGPPGLDAASPSRRCSVETCILLTRSGADLLCRDEKGCTPLCRAVVNNHKAAAICLALKGGGSFYLNLANENNDTPLSRACVLRLWDMAATLVWGLRANTATLKRNLAQQLRLQLKLIHRRQPDVHLATAVLVQVSSGSACNHQAVAESLASHLLLGFLLYVSVVFGALCLQEVVHLIQTWEIGGAIPNNEIASCVAKLGVNAPNGASEMVDECGGMLAVIQANEQLGKWKEGETPEPLPPAAILPPADLSDSELAEWKRELRRAAEAYAQSLAQYEDEELSAVAEGKETVDEPETRRARLGPNILDATRHIALHMARKPDRIKAAKQAQEAARRYFATAEAERETAAQKQQGKKDKKKGGAKGSPAGGGSNPKPSPEPRAPAKPMEVKAPQPAPPAQPSAADPLEQPKMFELSVEEAAALIESAGGEGGIGNTQEKKNKKKKKKKNRKNKKKDAKSVDDGEEEEAAGPRKEEDGEDEIDDVDLLEAALLRRGGSSKRSGSAKLQRSQAAGEASNKAKAPQAATRPTPQVNTAGKAQRSAAATAPQTTKTAKPSAAAVSTASSAAKSTNSGSTVPPAHAAKKVAKAQSSKVAGVATAPQPSQRSGGTQRSDSEKAAAVAPQQEKHREAQRSMSPVRTSPPRKGAAAGATQEAPPHTTPSKAKQGGASASSRREDGATTASTAGLAPTPIKTSKPSNSSAAQPQPTRSSAPRPRVEIVEPSAAASASLQTSPLRSHNTRASPAPLAAQQQEAEESRKGGNKDKAPTAAATTEPSVSMPASFTPLSTADPASMEELWPSLPSAPSPKSSATATTAVPSSAPSSAPSRQSENPPPMPVRQPADPAKQQPLASSTASDSVPPPASEVTASLTESTDLSSMGSMGLSLNISNLVGGQQLGSSAGTEQNQAGASSGASLGTLGQAATAWDDGLQDDSLLTFLPPSLVNLARSPKQGLTDIQDQTGGAEDSAGAGFGVSGLGGSIWGPSGGALGWGGDPSMHSSSDAAWQLPDLGDLGLNTGGNGSGGPGGIRQGPAAPLSNAFGAAAFGRFSADAPEFLGQVSSPAAMAMAGAGSTAGAAPVPATASLPSSLLQTPTTLPSYGSAGAATVPPPAIASGASHYTAAPGSVGGGGPAVSTDVPVTAAAPGGYSSHMYSYGMGPAGPTGPYTQTRPEYAGPPPPSSLPGGPTRDMYPYDPAAGAYPYGGYGAGTGGYRGGMSMPGAPSFLGGPGAGPGDPLGFDMQSDMRLYGGGPGGGLDASVQGPHGGGMGPGSGPGMLPGQGMAPGGMPQYPGPGVGMRGGMSPYPPMGGPLGGAGGGRTPMPYMMPQQPQASLPASSPMPYPSMAMPDSLRGAVPGGGYPGTSAMPPMTGAGGSGAPPTSAHHLTGGPLGPLAESSGPW